MFSEVHVERLLLFAVIWSYGGVLVREREQRRFSQLLKTLTNSLPDDDSEYSVFDYYVDESGEWDVWKTRYKQRMIVSYCVHFMFCLFVLLGVSGCQKNEALLSISLGVCLLTRRTL